MRRTVVGLGVVGSVLVGLGVVQLLPGGTPLAVTVAKAEGLVAYSSCEALLADVRADLMETAGPYGWGGNVGWADQASSSGAAPTAVRAEASDAVGSGPTGTNLQEQDVDEPDVTKLTGDRIVTVAAGALQVVRTGATPTLLGRLALPGPTDGAELDASSAELLVEGKRVLVVSRGWRQEGPDAAGTATTTLDLADLSDPSAPRWVDRWSVDGDQVSARLSGGAVRLVTTTHPSPVPVEVALPYGPEQEAAATAANREAVGRLTLEQVLPQASRTLAGGTTQTGAAVACDQVSQAPDAVGGGLLLVTTLEPSRGLSPTDAVAVVADGDLVYASRDRLVVATSRWGTGARGGAVFRGRPSGPTTTTLHTFDTTGRTSTRYVASGDVPGSVLGRWALSYDAGHLRVVTTEQPDAGQRQPRPIDPVEVDPVPVDPVDVDRPVNPEDLIPIPAPEAPRTVSTLTVLAEDGDRLVRTGSVTGLGRGEQVQAVRFFGDLATVVTFRQTDPLYVLDLSDPMSPTVTGELKVSGFSTYLHPLGGDLLLGLGREADETGGQLGMQASVFDLADRARPTQLSRVQMGEAYSPAESDSRAFTYDPARRQVVLLAETASPDYLPSTSVRALAVSAGGEVTAAARTEMPMAMPYGARVFVDGDRVLVVGPEQVVALDADGLTPTGTLRLR